jgi:hypothetical protein
VFDFCDRVLCGTSHGSATAWIDKHPRKIRQCPLTPEEGGEPPRMMNRVDFSRRKFIKFMKENVL